MRTWNGRKTANPRRAEAGGSENRAYADGTAVRIAESRPAENSGPELVERKRTSEKTERNREKNLRMNLGYVAFITVAAAVTTASCVGYLQLKAKSILLAREVVSLKSTLDEMRLENDEREYEATVGMDMNAIWETATEKLGMGLPNLGQIVTYDAPKEDYVWQFVELPEGNAKDD